MIREDGLGVRVQIGRTVGSEKVRLWSTAERGVKTVSASSRPSRIESTRASAAQSLSHKGVVGRRTGMRTHHYPSDVTDEQWALIEALIPVYPGGRPRTTSTRDVLDAILYMLRTGCQWRYLPTDFPPRSTVWRYFDQWRSHGPPDTIPDLLPRTVRTVEKPRQPRPTASRDSPPADTTSGGEARGRDHPTHHDG